MATAALYINRPTAGGVDGDAVTESEQGSPKMVLAAQRGLWSLALPIAVRSSNGSVYLARVTPKGPKAGQIRLSYNGENWLSPGSFVFFEQVATVNTLFYAQSYIEEEAEYVDDLTNYLELSYLPPV